MKPVLLVAELHHLGDVVLAVPFLRAAAAHFTVHIVCRPPALELLSPLLPREQIHLWNPPWEPDSTSPAGSWISLLRALRKLQPSIFVSAWPDARAGWIGFLSGARHRYGFPMSRRNYHAIHLPWRRRNLFFGKLLEAVSLGSLYTHKLHRKREDQHRVEDWMQLAEAFQFFTEFPMPWWEEGLWPKEESLVVWKKQKAGRKILAIAPHARLPTKTWPGEQFASTISQLLEERIPDLQIVVVYPSGVEIEPGIWPSEIKFRATGTIAELAGVLSISDVLLANDSFAGHFASSLGVRVCTIFGSGSPDWFRPWGKSNRVVRVQNCAFHPCIDRCQMPSVICLEAINPAEVLSSVRELLLAAGQGGGRVSS